MPLSILRWLLAFAVAVLVICAAGAASAQGSKRYVWLGTCTEGYGWTFQNFKHGKLLDCRDRRLPEAREITALRGMKLRDALPHRSGTEPADAPAAWGREIARIKAGKTIRLLALHRVSRYMGDRPDVYWGEVE